MLLKGKPVAEAIDERSLQAVRKLKEKGVQPTLALFKVGENDSNVSYERGILKKSEQLGINVVHYNFEQEVKPEEFYLKLAEINNDDSVHGILLFRPLPKRFKDDELRNFINPKKDIDGCSDLSLTGIFTDNENCFAPCTAEAVIEMLKYYNIEIKGKRVVVIGRSLVIGKPVSMLLLKQDATVTILHSQSKDIQKIARDCDILVCATGKLELINKDYVSPDQTVIDVGIGYHQIKQKLCGDVLFDEVEPLVRNITPVPGGVGSLTTSLLLNHVVRAAERIQAI